VLVVEDSPVNQAVTTAILERLGYEATVAASGVEALQVVFRQQFAAVLMDCHLPAMDGYQATVEIRRREDGQEHVPIIAMTADAMPGTRERCLAAGMDDYLSKPISVAVLDRMLAVWIGNGPPAAVEGLEQVPMTTDAALGDVLDHALIAELQEAQPGLLGALIEIFADEGPRHLAGLESALDAGDQSGAVLAIHTLKGSAATIGALALASLSLQVEKITRDGRTDEVVVLIPSLEQELRRALQALDRLRMTQATS
jgi:CheY-like chemotaxis protein